MNKYLIIGHSQHTSDKFKLKKGQYIIFSVKCGKFSYITGNNGVIYANEEKLNNITKKLMNSNTNDANDANDTYQIYKPGQYVPNQIIQFSASGSKNVFLKGAFELPLTKNLSNAYLTKGFNKNSLQKWFGENYNINYEYDLESLLDDIPGIYFVHTCRGIDGISFEKSKIGILKQDGNIEYIPKPKTKKRNESNTESLNTKNMLKSFKASTLPKRNMGSMRIALKKAHKIMQEENEVTSRKKLKVKT